MPNKMLWKDLVESFPKRMRSTVGTLSVIEKTRAKERMHPSPCKEKGFCGPCTRHVNVVKQNEPFAYQNKLPTTHDVRDFLSHQTLPPQLNHTTTVYSSLLYTMPVGKVYNSLLDNTSR